VTSMHTTTFAFTGCLGCAISIVACSSPASPDENAGGDNYPVEPVVTAQGSGTITPVLFVPTDRSVNPLDISSVEAGLADVRSWYETQLVSARLRMDKLEVVQGSHESSYYIDSDRIWNDGPAEVESSLGFGPWSSGHIVLLVGAGLLGWAGGAGTGNAGYAVLGLESLTNNAACASEWWCNPDMWRGTAIHELGHALTLVHSVNPSIMAFHGDYQNRVLLDTATWPEKTKVRALPFVDLLGGSANWAPCQTDADCLSQRCGCNDKTVLVCLPSPDYPVTCASGQPTCGDLAKQSGWANALCEWNGNGACGGIGAATSDCDHCCDASQVPPPDPQQGPSCGELAAQNGWANAACEWSGNGACGGVGTPTWDCDHCCQK